MNERIKKLKDQCWVEKCWDNGMWIEKHIDLELFAELIVKECARIARATPCPYEEDEVIQRLGHTWDMASLEAGRGISKHFGVEE